MAFVSQIFSETLIYFFKLKPVSSHLHSSKQIDVRVPREGAIKSIPVAKQLIKAIEKVSNLNIRYIQTQHLYIHIGLIVEHHT